MIPCLLLLLLRRENLHYSRALFLLALSTKMSLEGNVDLGKIIFGIR